MDPWQLTRLFTPSKRFGKAKAIFISRACVCVCWGGSEDGEDHIEMQVDRGRKKRIKSGGGLEGVWFSVHFNQLFFVLPASELRERYSIRNSTRCPCRIKKPETCRSFPYSMFEPYMTYSHISIPSHCLPHRSFLPKSHSPYPTPLFANSNPQSPDPP